MRLTIYEYSMTKSASRSIFTTDRSTLNVTYLVFDGSSLMSIASAIDPLRAANRVAGQTCFDFRLVSLDGKPVATTCGLPIAVSGALDPGQRCDLLVIIAGFGMGELKDRKSLATIRRAAGAARALGGIESGSWVLARAGLLDDRAATTHWEDMEEFAARFPGVDVRPDRYVIDGPVFTTGGASPTFDLMLHLVRARLGVAAALDVASVFIYDESHSASDAQPLVSLGRLVGNDPRVAHAIRIMEAGIDQPISIAAIASRIGVSTRTLEQVFDRAVGETPGAYFLRLRLSAARRFVKDTRIPLADIAARTGFSSASTFSRAFRRAYGLSPQAQRAALNDSNTDRRPMPAP